MDCPEGRRCDTEAAASGLPDDPLVEILSRVPVKSLCRFKCVSKAWRDLIADPDNRKKLPQTLEGFFFMHPEHRDSDGKEPPRQLYGFFDVMQRSVRTVDFSYLPDLPGPDVHEETVLLHCCNGLLLFAADYNGVDYNGRDIISEGYIVCNPATKQSVAVPSSFLTWEKKTFFGFAFTYLLFDPGLHCHFNLVQFLGDEYITSVHIYSSKTQAWSHNKRALWGYRIARNSPGVYVNSMLHLLSYLYFGKDQLTVVDVEGNKQKIIPAPCQVGRATSGYIGQSQGFLYYIYHEPHAIRDGFGLAKQFSGRLLIWVLQDYDRKHWVLKDSVSFSKLFGERDCHMKYDIVGIHPYHRLIFFVQHCDRKLISYNMDSKEVCDLCTLGHGYNRITPYVPYFSEFDA